MTNPLSKYPCSTVSHHGNVTVKRECLIRNTSRNSHETSDLKALALQILERNRQRNNHETGMVRGVSTPASDDVLTYYAECYEERAAIYQYDGKYSQTESEWQAMNDVLVLYSATRKVPSGSNEFNNFMLALHAVTNFNNQRMV